MKYGAHRNDKVASGSQRHLKSHSEVTSGAGTSTAPHLLEQQQFLYLVCFSLRSFGISSSQSMTNFIIL